MVDGQVTANHFLAQSLNSPFFLPPIGAEPEQAKRESTITFMRMLRTNQSKITRFQPRCSRQCAAQCLFSVRALQKKNLDIVVKNMKNVKTEIYFIVPVLLSTTRTRHYSFPKDFFKSKSLISIVNKFLQRSVFRYL